MPSDYEILQKPFDIDVHREHFYCYLEVIIRPDGVIEYAVPSHQEKLKRLCIQLYGLDKFLHKLETEQEATYDYLKWLCNCSGCISVWNDFCSKPDNCTQAQLNSLKLLSDTCYAKGTGDLKLYRGEI